MVKRSLLYLRRKYKRSVLLFLLLFVISFCLSVGICVWRSIGTVTHEIQQTLGTSFIVRMHVSLTHHPANLEDVTEPDGTTRKVYTGPKLDDNTIDQIMQIDGITTYNADNYLEAYPHLDDLQLVPGMWNLDLQDRAAHPEDYADDERITEEYATMRSRATMLYGNSDTSLAAKFRTGAFELVEGRHIRPEDRHVVLLSDKLAELNDLKIGDTISMTARDGGVFTGNALSVLGEAQQLTIVGFFRVNGYQPTGKYVSEDDMTYNWALTDLDTVKALRSANEQAQYGKNYEQEPQYQNVTFFVDDPKRLDEIIAQVKRMDTIDADSYQIAADDTMYKSTVDALQGIRNLIVGVVGVIVAGCTIILLVVFTMWVGSRKKEIAIYLSLGLHKASIIGQFVLEAALIAVLAGTLSFAVSQKVPDQIGSQMLASTIQAAQPQEKEYTREELHQAAMSGTMDELMAYESSEYIGPKQIDFSFQFTDVLILLAMELLIIVAAICKGGSFLFRLQPRQILTTLR